MRPVPTDVLVPLATAYTANVSSLRTFGGGRAESDGIVYSYRDGETARLLKILALPDDGVAPRCFEERLRFTSFLAERGAPVIVPRPSLAGAPYETVRQGGAAWVAYSMNLAAGRPHGASDWDEPFFRRWGRAVGMVHRLTRDYPAREPLPDPASGLPLMTWEAEWAGFERECPDEEVRGRWQAIRRELDGLPRDSQVFGFTHNDPHIENVLDDGQRLTLLDFDVASAHWFASDIAIACQSVLGFLSGGLSRPLHSPARLERFLGCFLEGYAREHAPALLDRLDLFIAYRRVLLFIVMQSWLATRRDVLRSWRKMIVDQPDVVRGLSLAAVW